MSRKPNPKKRHLGSRKRHPPTPGNGTPDSHRDPSGSAAKNGQHLDADRQLKTASTSTRIGSLLHPARNWTARTEPAAKEKTPPRPKGTRQSRVAALTLTRSPARAYRSLGTQTARIENGRQKERAVPNIRHGPKRFHRQKLTWEQ